MKSAKEIVASITEEMFLTEPLMFDVFCSHTLQENTDIQVMFRTGKGRIEYKPGLVTESFRKNGNEGVEIALKNEILRILLLHPYQRVPENPNRIALKKASDITINSISPYMTQLPDAMCYQLQEGLSFEEYYKELKQIFPEPPKNSSGQGQPEENGAGNSGEYDSTELWTEDSGMCDKIESQIKKAVAAHKWGSLSGETVENILASKRIMMDYKKILMKFRSSVSSDSRSLTRLRPNRRYDFDYMGSRYKPSFNLLVAVDVSGSISHEDLINFFSIINRFFKYGAKNIKVIVFDTTIKQEMDFKKAKQEIKVMGRGGTSFQAAVDYYEKSKEYAGMIVLTDGYADTPVIRLRKKILWIFNNKENYTYNKKLQNLPGCSATWIPKNA